MNGLLGDDIDPRTQGLLALGLGLMQGRGNFGQAFGAAGQQALSAYQGAQDRDKRKRMMEQQERTLAHQQSVAEWQHEQARKQAEEAAQNQAWIRSMPGPQMQASQAAMEGGGGPTLANAAKVKPISPQQELMWGMVQRGIMTPQAYMEATRKQQPKLSKLEQMKDDSGRLRNVAVFEDGTTSVLPYGVKPEIALQNLGNRMVAIDKNETAGGASWQMGATPDAMVSQATQIRGQNMTNDRAADANARAAEANRIAAEGNIVKTETDLRKEFADLPEVKRYKAALPAYNAVAEAAKRGTPQSDINLVYGLAKLYDPDSVVREGEYATIANSQAIPEWLKGMAQRVAGGGRLTPETKQQIMVEANGRIGSYQREYEGAQKTYTDIVTQRGGRPGSVFTPVGTSRVVDLADLPGGDLDWNKRRK